MLEFIIKLHPEIAIKSKSVRQRQTGLLERNLITILKRLDPKIAVRNVYDHLIVRSKLTAERENFIARLECIPGIVTFAESKTCHFTDLHDIFLQVAAVYRDQLNGKTFCVRVKRQGEHEFSSLEAERYIGGGLNQLVNNAKVQLKQPDITIKLEIKQDKFLVVVETFSGMGGFPIPSQQDVLSLISGGYDSAVATYLMIRKGIRSHFLFFNLGGNAHEAGVREIAFYIWQKYGLSHRVKFVSIDFMPVVNEIVEKVDSSLLGVVLKRMMMRAASHVAGQLGIQAIVTGESIGQVASQTIANLSVIDRATDTLILRPLIYHDKQDIIDIARQIGVEALCSTMPEYCGVISKSPTIHAELDAVLAAEAQCDAALLSNVLSHSKVYDIRTIEYQAEQQARTVTTEAVLPRGAVVIDVRTPDETEQRPLQLQHHRVLEIPFFRLASQFPHLDPQQQYYCYCEHGVMSRLQTLLLQEMGFTNIAVYRS